MKKPEDKKQGNGKKRVKAIVIVIIVFVLLNIVGTQIWMLNYKGYLFSKGNGGEYSLKNVEELEDSPLKGMNIAFLGSSVTEGARSRGISFVEYLAKRNGFSYVKEAVSGTTLVDNGEESYVSRLQNNLDVNADFDMMVVQLSTNDAGKDAKPLGAVSDSDKLEDLDTSTVIGAVEFIICYVQKTWDCPVVFYTGTKNDKEGYGEMVDALYMVQEKWGIEIIDLWKDLDVDIPDYSLYMSDPVHPSQAGYLEWWTPAMEERLYRICGSMPGMEDE